jgi:hypothetical protein
MTEHAQIEYRLKFRPLPTLNHRIEKLSERVGGLLARYLVELDVVPKIRDRSLDARKIETVICVGINDELHRGTVALLAGNSRIVLAGHQFARGSRRGPIIAFPYQNQGWDRHRSLYGEAGGIERSGRTK